MRDDPRFRQIIGQVRGFDLDDDAELLAYFDARDDITATDDLLLHAVLLHRAGRDAAAAEILAGPTRDGEPKAGYLRAALLTIVGEAAAALPLLDALPTTDADAALTAHGRGTVLHALGRPAEALEAYLKGFERDPETADGDRWWQTARLLADLGRHADALEAYGKALDAKNPPEAGDDLRFDQAALLAHTAATITPAPRAESAIRDVRDRLGHHEFHRRAAGDPRFDAVRDHPAIAPLLDAPELGWLDEFPAWLRDLRDDPRTAELGIVWLDRDESADAADIVHSGFTGENSFGATPSDKVLKAMRKEFKTKNAVARGPVSRNRYGLSDTGYWFVDRKNPDGLLFAPSDEYLPALWIPAGTTIDSVTRTVRHFHPTPRLGRTDLHREYRAFIGYRHEVGDVHDIERGMTFNRLVDFCTWSSGHLDDPWPDVIPAQPSLTLKINGYHMRTAHRHDPKRLWSLSWRTRHSRSHFTVEVHQNDIFVASIRYRPSPWPEVTERANRLFDTRLPADMPPDVVLAMQDFGWADAPDLEADLASTRDPAETAGLLRVLVALWDGDLERMSRLREYAHSGDARLQGVVWNAALQYNLMFLVDELLLAGTTPQLEERCRTVLDMGVFPYHMRHQDAYPRQAGTEPYLDDDGDEEDDE